MTKKVILFVIDISGSIPDNTFNQIKEDIVKKLGNSYNFDDNTSAFIVSCDTDPYELQYIDNTLEVKKYPQIIGCGSYLSRGIKQLTDNNFSQIDELCIYSDMHVGKEDMEDIKKNNPDTNITWVDINPYHGKKSYILPGMKLETDVIKKIYIRGDEEKNSCSLADITGSLIGKTIKDVKYMDGGLYFEFEDGSGMEATYDTSEMGNIFFEVK